MCVHVSLGSSILTIACADVAGEYVRKDVTEKQAGVPLWIDIDIVDVTTCKPITDVWVEIWCKFTWAQNLSLSECKWLT